jgi:IMP dehydrogenase/GMP reductase
MEAQAASDGVDKADDFKQMVARGGIDQMRDGGVHHRRMMAA